MKPTTVLKQEHRAVERVLRVLNRAADRLDEEDVSPAIFEDSSILLSSPTSATMVKRRSCCSRLWKAG